MSIVTVDEQELKNRLGKGRGVVADFYADWCRPCHAIAPLMESLAAEYHSVDFVKVDADADPGLVQELGILGIPTVVHFGPDGREVGRTVGFAPAQQIARNLKLAS